MDINYFYKIYLKRYMRIMTIKKVIITDDTTDEQLEKIHAKALREYMKKGYSSYLIVDEDE